MLSLNNVLILKAYYQSYRLQSSVLVVRDQTYFLFQLLDFLALHLCAERSA